MYVWLDLFNVNSTFTVTATGYTATITSSSTNASVSGTGAAAPAFATLMGVEDSSGNLQAVSAANPLPVNVSLSTNDNYTIISATPIVTATTYGANKVLGGLLTLTGAVNTTTNVGYLNSITLNFSTVAPIEGFIVVLFKANPSASTLTDNTTANINSADVSKIIGWFSITNYTSVLGSHTTYVANKLDTFVAGTAGNIYAAVICQGASVMASTGTFVNAVFSLS